MRLDNRELHSLLVEKDIQYLCHANTVSTVITYLEEGGIMSRGEVERRYLHQSPQSSDALDKVFDVWDGIFLDTIDLHGYFPRQNYYGPVLLKFSLDFLLAEDYEIWVTKDNPINWKVDMDNSERYFTSVSELRNDWDKYDRQKKMFTIRNCHEPILLNYIFSGLLDDPRVKIEGEVVVFNEGIRALKQALANNEPLKNKFATRSCPSHCFCRSNYLHQVPVADLKRLFFPKNNSV